MLGELVGYVLHMHVCSSDHLYYTSSITDLAYHFGIHMCPWTNEITEIHTLYVDDVTLSLHMIVCICDHALVKVKVSMSLLTILLG